MLGIARRIGALLLLVGLMPVLALLAALVGLFQGRPVLFEQIRSGKNGIPFKMIKFRTMRNLKNADGELLSDEARVTTIGRFLRKTRLDELPGIWHVVTGQMSFIGPRPLLPETISALGARGIRRGAALPGLTGWAQVNGNTLLSLDEKVSLDLWYIANRSVILDLQVLLATLRVAVGGEKRSTNLTTSSDSSEVLH